MIVNVLSMSFTLGDLEPFFVSMALYNVKKKQKLSETFHVDVNSVNIAQLLEKKVKKNNFLIYFLCIFLFFYFLFFFYFFYFFYFLFLLYFQVWNFINIFYYLFFIFTIVFIIFF